MPRVTVPRRSWGILVALNGGGDPCPEARWGVTAPARRGSPGYRPGGRGRLRRPGAWLDTRRLTLVLRSVRAEARRIAAVNNSLRGCPSSSTTTAPRMAIAQGSAGVIIVVGETEGAPGDFVSFDVTLDTGGLGVAGTQNDIAFDPSTPIAAAGNGNPQCRVNPNIDKSATTFRFQPPGCEDTGIGLCTGIRALVLSLSNVDPIPDGSVMYGCSVAIATDAPAEIFPLVNDNVVSSDPEGIPLPTLGEDGAVTVVGGPTATCGGDINRDNQVTISELIAAVNNSLRGCPSQ